MIGADVVLTWSEVFEAAIAGVTRRIQTQRRGARRPFEPRDVWGTDIDAAIAERAVAKHYGCYWAGRGAYDPAAADVGRTAPIEVRSTPYVDGHLCVYPGDHDDRPYVLVTGAAPRVSVRGWLWGHEAKADRYWHDPAPRGCVLPCFWIAPGELHDPDALRDYLSSRSGAACFR